MHSGSSTRNYLLGDHLGSTAITTNSSGTRTAEVRYYPWGTERYTSGTTPTTYKFTGQRQESGIGLYFYNSRWYDPYLNRWIQPDDIILNPGNSQDLDRYAYVRNNPTRYIDPTGHFCLKVGSNTICTADDDSNGWWIGMDQENNNDDASSTNQGLEEVFSDDNKSWEDQTLMEDGDYTWWIKYKSLTFGTAIPNPYTGILIGWHITITMDQYGEWYVGGGLDVDKSPLLVNVSYVYGQISQQDLPRNKQDEPGFLQNFLSGNSIQVYIAPFVDIQLNFPFSGGTAFDLV
jgi:RHS repeat-associated protein